MVDSLTDFSVRFFLGAVAKQELKEEKKEIRPLLRTEEGSGRAQDPPEANKK